MTVIFDQTSNFAAIPNLLGSHPGASMLRGWITQRVAKIAIKKRLRPGWYVHLDGLKGELRDRDHKPKISFEIVKGHRL